MGVKLTLCLNRGYRGKGRGRKWKEQLLHVFNKSNPFNIGNIWKETHQFPPFPSRNVIQT